MLFIDNVMFKLPMALEMELRGELRGGKRLKFPKEFATKTKDDKGNEITEYPASKSVPFVARVDLDLDTYKLKSSSSTNFRYVEVRYATGYGKHHKPELPHYTPSGLRDITPLQEHDTELYWFLKYCSPFIKNGLNGPSNRLKNWSLVIDDPEKDEREEAEREELIYSVGTLIFDPNYGLKENKLRDIAAAFGVSDSVKGRLPGVKVKLKKAVATDETFGKASGVDGLKGYKYFLKLAQEDFDFSLRANITKAIDCKIIEYVPSKKGWYFLGDTPPGAARVYEEKIVNCETTVDSKESFLADFFARTPEIKARFEDKLGSKLNEGGGDQENEYENLKSLKSQYEDAGETEKLIETIEKMLAIKPNNPKLKGELKQAKQALEA